MAVPFAKIPGEQSRSLRNNVPGLRFSKDGGGRRVYGAVLGISTEVEDRRKKIGRVLGWASLVLALFFMIGGVFRLVMWSEDLAKENVQMVFATLGIVSAIGVHFLLFAAEALRGRDAPRAVLAVLIFWVTFLLGGGLY
jgi:hypothetical protein